MNSDGKLRTWGDADFARKLVEFAKIEVIAGRDRRRRRLRQARGGLRARPLHYWGTENTKDYSPDVTGKITEQLVRAERKSNASRSSSGGRRRRRTARTSRRR